MPHEPNPLQPGFHQQFGTPLVRNNQGSKHLPEAFLLVERKRKRGSKTNPNAQQNNTLLNLIIPQPIPPLNHDLNLPLLHQSRVEYKNKDQIVFDDDVSVLFSSKSRMGEDG